MKAWILFVTHPKSMGNSKLALESGVQIDLVHLTWFGTSSKDKAATKDVIGEWQSSPIGLRSHCSVLGGFHCVNRTEQCVQDT